MRLIYGLSVMVAGILFASNIAAQCTKDTDCKGDRICRTGSCVDPGTTSTSAAPVPEIEGETKDQAKEDFERVKAALPEFDHEGDYFSYGRRVASGQTVGSFIDYKRYRIQKYKRHGIARLVVGSILTAFSIPVLVFAGLEMQKDNGDEDSIVPLFIIGPSLAVTGIPVLISGIVRATRWPRMEQGMLSLETASRQTRTVARQFAVAPMVSKEASSFGLAGVYCF